MLKRRQYPRRNFILINVAGVLGAGFYVGIGETINLAGPSTFLLFLVVGFIGLMVMLFQEEMISHGDNIQSFPEIALFLWGPLGQAVSSGSYILAWSCGLLSEILAAGMLLHALIPSMGVTLLCGLIMVFILVMNYVNFLWFRAEFYLSFIGVFFLMAFGIVAIVSMCGLFPNIIKSVGFTQYASLRDIFPGGTVSMISAIAGVVMIYGGIESMGMIADESMSPETNYISASRSSLYRVIIIYAVASFALGGVLSCTGSSFVPGPFPRALEQMGFDPLLNIPINIFFVLMAISTAMYGIHIPAKLLYSMKEKLGIWNRRLDYLSGESRSFRYPFLILPVCLVIAALYEIYGQAIYSLMFNLAGCGFLIIWGMIIIALPLYRRKIRRIHGGEYRPLVREAQVICPLLMCILAAGIVSLLTRNVGRIAVWICLIWYGILILIYRLYVKKRIDKDVMLK